MCCYYQACGINTGHRESNTDATAPPSAISFKICDQNYRIAPGQTCDFLSVRPNDGTWNITDYAATVAVLAALEAQLTRLKPLA